MNGQYLCNRQITVSYAYKKDTKGERHGTPAGKLLFMEYVSLIEVLSTPYTHDVNGPCVNLVLLSFHG